MASAEPAAPFVIQRTFKAPRELVFAAWTDPHHLQQWFGPKGVTMPSCTMDLRPGGVFHYCMQWPDGTPMWGKWTFKEIDPPRRLVAISAFSDEHGGLGRHPMAPEWPSQMLMTVAFEDVGGGTLVSISVSSYESTEAESRVFNAGHGSMTQGWGGTFDRFDAYLDGLT